MMPGDLQKLLAEGESEHLEFKTGQASPEAVAKTVCAFLNKGGGKLVLGVGEQKQIVGVSDADSRRRLLESELPTLISPVALWTVEQVPVAGKDVLLVEVLEGHDKPYVVGGAIYLRHNARVVPASRDEIKQLVMQRVESGQRWERQIAVGADLDDIDSQLVRHTMRLAVESQRWQGAAEDVDRFLNSLGLIEQGGVTNAALLLYGRNPSRLLPQARVRLLVMPEGKTADRYLVDRLFEDCLLQAAKQIPEALALQIGGVESRFSGDWQRSDRPIYPMTALREGVMNALVHRDYTVSGSTLISILQDYLRISNPGGLPDNLKPSDLKKNHPSLPRNPSVAHVCFLHGLIEKIGRGTQRIVEDCRKASLPEPKWQTSALETTLTVFSATKRTRNAEEALNERQERILTVLQEQGRLLPGEVSKLVGATVSDRTVRTDLQVLVDRGLMIRRGRGRSTSYALAKLK